MSKIKTICLCLAFAFVIFCSQGDSGKVTTPQFVPPELCFSCHQQQHQDWQGSHHQLAMQPANQRTVLGNFSNAEYSHFGVVSKFFQREGKFFVHTDDNKGKMQDFEIKYTFGVHPLQQYLVETSQGRLQALSIAWDVNAKRWFHLYNEKISHEDPLHWTGLQQNANFMCIECHTTGFQKNYDVATNTYHSNWQEIHVGCQSCHGPGSQHITWVQTQSNSKTKGFAVNLADKQQEIENCARCHSRRYSVSPQYKHGEGFLDHYMPQLLTESFYHVDGQILDEVYVYGSFLQSKKYHQGVKCSDCHNPHTAQLVISGDGLCVRCHTNNPPEQFPSIKGGNYRSKQHHFHDPNSSGARCVNCHIPEKVYMGIDPRRDHSFRIPRPDQSLTLGTPNACNNCHQDKTIQWAAKWVETWYPQSTKRRETFAEVFATARNRNIDALPKLTTLVQNPKKYPEIVRATGVDLLASYRNSEVLVTLRSLLKDSSALVRSRAVVGIGSALANDFSEESQQFQIVWISPLLRDPVRLVRVEAARVLAHCQDSLTSTTKQDFAAALKEFIGQQNASLDRPEAHMNLALLFEAQRLYEKAETSYKKAISIDPHFHPASLQLSNLYHAIGQQDLAMQQLREIVSRSPKHGAAYYSLGLLLAEQKKLPEAKQAMERAVSLLPSDVRAHYNYALILQNLGETIAAEKIFLQTLVIEPQNLDVLYAVVILYCQQKQWKKALPYAELLTQYSSHPSYGQLLQRIRQAITVEKSGGKK